MDHCRQDNVPIYRCKKGEGELYSSSPRCCCIYSSLKKERREELVEIEAFLNGIVAKIQSGILKTMDIPLNIKGMEDLCIANNKKILGSSVLYSTRDFISLW